ncbi:MAG: 30S ribosomal protein S17 [Rhodobacteraceae bacterium]|nr:30S ribosomal protein S17 [Paracoccaceae bacterium]
MPRKILTGKVISSQSEGTVTVRVERRFMHPVMQKTVRKSKRYRAHDAGMNAKVGDVIRIRECPPRSKTKCWEVVEQAS